MHKKLLYVFIAYFCSQNSSFADAVVKDDLCRSLENSVRSNGLFLVSSNGEIKRVNGRAMKYSNASRFIFIDQRLKTGPSEEKIFLIRLSTMSKNGREAGAVKVVRRARVACDRALPETNPQFVTRPQYHDHHSGNPGDIVTGLRRNFHFEGRDRQVAQDCFRTDDPRVVDTADAYRFPADNGNEKIARGLTAPERNSQAQASVDRAVAPWNGLTSELVARSPNSNVCMAFGAPLPTYGGAAETILGFNYSNWANREAQRWTPLSTRVEILTLAKKESSIGRYSIKWSSE